MTIDRTQFLPAGAVNEDFPFPLTDTCSVPSESMAYLLAGLAGEGESVLEIGTGSGYQTAVLAERFKEVVSIEACPLCDLQRKLPSNVCLIVADGMTHDTGEQFDAIVVTFAASHIPQVWVEQLKVGGILVVPIQAGPSCRLSVFHKDLHTLILDDVVGYAPFTPEVGLY